ncbi:hypothetical protein ISF6_0977 [Piscinibacter sakaiensis]|uniref:Uncharacterized protein n=1 Tax=Piscinibacter sakaiensis TaxID=1547922 RepID=A0A0K8NTZ5_PISS1|nr:hypothetical protein ISF6_0977 [Piscinibacter sakaiensis]
MHGCLGPVLSWAAAGRSGAAGGAGPPGPGREGGCRVAALQSARGCCPARRSGTRENFPFPDRGLPGPGPVRPPARWRGSARRGGGRPRARAVRLRSPASPTPCRLPSPCPHPKHRRCSPPCRPSSTRTPAATS